MYKEEYSTITGTYPDGRHHAITVMEGGKEKVARLDMSKPVTLQRMRDVCERLSAKTGVVFDYIQVEHHVYEFDIDPNDKEARSLIDYGDIPGVKTWDKTYQYWADQNRLLIWDHGYPVYENNNGVICNDEVALADCLC